MKRILSWLAMIIVFIIGAVVIWYVIHFGTLYASKLYGYSQGLFWVVVTLGGSFCLSITYVLAFLTTTYTYRLSERIKPSRKGLRYKVFSIIMAVDAIVNIILVFVTHYTGFRLPRELLANSFVIYMCYMLFAFGLSQEDVLNTQGVSVEG